MTENLRTSDAIIHSTITVGELMRKLNAMCVREYESGNTKQAIWIAKISWSVETALELSGLTSAKLVDLVEQLYHEGDDDAE